MFFYALLISCLAILCELHATAANKLDSILDIQGEPHDRLHELVVLNQIDNYIRPIESLETRTYKSLNGLWSFCLDAANEGHSSRWFEKNLRDECIPRGNFLQMPVPSAFNEIPSNKTVKNYMGWMWYQTHLRWPLIGADLMYSELIEQQNSWILQMESVNYMSVIWVQIMHGDNNQTHLVGSHAGGHLPITLDLSGILNGLAIGKSKLGQFARFTGSIRLTIAVSNMLTSETIPSGKMLNETEAVGRPYYKFQPDFDFFHFAGIMGDVNLIKLPASYIADVQMVADTSSSSSPALIELTLSRPLGEPMQVCWLLSELRSRAADKWTSSGVDENSDCFRLERWTKRANLPIANASFAGWASLQILLQSSNNDGPRVYDLVELNVPINRRLALEAQLPIGRKWGQLQGFGVHHEQLFSGRTMGLAAIMKDLNLIKQMGANVLRTSHYPYSSAYLDACDELNLMVIAECPAVGLNSFSDAKLRLHKQILREMMQRDQRHPAIIMWSLANEPESQLPEARDYFAKLVEYARTDLRRFTLDARRPLTAAIAQSHSDDKIGHLFDVVMVNRYYGWYECTALVECVRHSLVTSLEGWARKYPGKPLLISEFGADTLAGFHSTTNEIFSEEYQRDLLVAYEQVFDHLARPSNVTGAAGDENSGGQTINFLGSMIWNFADFSTHDSLMRPGGNRKGVFTRWREPKLAAESIKRIYTARSGHGPIDARCVRARERAPHAGH